MSAAVGFRAARNRSTTSRRRLRVRVSRLLAVAIATLLFTAGLSVPQWVSTVTGAVAEAAGTGTGGQFVPLQARLVDSRDGTGGFTGPLSSNVYQSFQAGGVAGIPASGVTALAVTVTAINTTSSTGWLLLEKDSTTPVGATTMLLYNATETVSNTGIVELSTAGKFMIASPTAVNVIVDVQGYFLAGNGTPAPGGFVPVTASTVTTLSGLTPGSTTDSIQLTGLAGVPATATAAFINITVDNTAAGSADNWVTVYPTGVTRPTPSLNYSAGDQVAIGTTVDLNAMGAFSLYNATNGANVTVKIDVYGYFDGEPSNAAYNTNQIRLYDSRQATPTPVMVAGNGGMLPVTVGGVGGMPTHSASVTAFALNISVVDETAPGTISVNSSDDSATGLTAVAYQNNYDSNLVLVRPGADQKIIITNNGPSPVNVIVDAQGWFVNNQALPAAVGNNPTTSGSRDSASMVSQAMSDRSGASVNPTNGNLLITQKLLSLSGIGQSLNIGLRYNSLNDTRPTLNMGLFESQLFRKSDLKITYTDPVGTAFNFGPTSNGKYSTPNDINAHLTRTVNGTPNAAISSGATYELVFHPSQIKNVYISDGANLKLVRTEDITGANNVTYTYGTGSNGGKLTSITDSQGRIVNLSYSSSPNPTQPTTITDTSLNRTITLEYNGPSGALSKVTDATGAVTTWDYNSNGKVSKIINVGTGRSTDFTYTATLFKLSTAVFGSNDSTNSNTWTVTYPTTAQTKIKDSNNNTVTYNFDVTSKQVASVVDPLGHTGNAVFNTHGDLTSRTTATSDQTQYDVASSTFNLNKVTAPAAGAGGGTARTTEYTFPASVTNNGDTPDYRPTSVKDAQANITTMDYNNWGQTVTAARGSVGAGAPLGGTVTYKYKNSNKQPGTCTNSRSGQLCQMVDAKGSITAYAYDTAGNVATVTPPSPLGARTFTYDAAGRQISATDGRGNTAYTCYDKNDRILQISYTSSNCAVASGVTYTFDTAGNVLTRKNSAGTTTYVYDAQNRVTSRSGLGGTSSATYDRVGNVLTAVDGGTGSANTTTYKYDTANRLVSLAEPGGSCPATPAIPNSTKCSTFSYDDANRRTVTTYPTGVKNTVTYVGSRITNMSTTNTSSTVLASRAYTYVNTAGTADTGLVGAITDQTGAVTTLSHDQMNRLTGASITSGGTVTNAWSWTFDVNSNRTQQNASGTITNYGYNAADQLCWSGTGTSATCTAPAGAATYTYDGNGNQTSGGNSYNAYDQLSATTAGGSQSYSYSGTSNNERLTAGATTFTNNLANQLAQQVNGSSTTKFVRDPQGTLIAMQTSSGSFYYSTDNVGSVILMTGASQAAVATYAYDPYGKLTASSGTQAGNNPYRYATGYLDSSSIGTYKMGARYYNPTLGRFTQTDPSGQESNAYIYAGANPTTYNDPTGLFVEVPSDYVLNPSLGTLNDFCSYSSDQYDGLTGGFADFRGPCARHDQCYGNAPGGSLYDCDVALGSDLRENCEEAYDWYNSDRYACYTTATIMQAAVTVAW